MVKLELVAVPVSVWVAVKLIVWLPPVVGVPEISPVAELRVSPAGKVPEASE
jgi:hypothetical protein